MVLPCDFFTTLLRCGKRTVPDAEARTSAAKVAHLSDSASEGFATMVNLNNTHWCSAFACARSKVVHVYDSMGGDSPSVGHDHTVTRMKMVAAVLGMIDSAHPSGPNGVQKWTTKFRNLPSKTDSYRCGPLAFNFLVMGFLGDVDTQGIGGDVARLSFPTKCAAASFLDHLLGLHVVEYSFFF